MVQRIKTGMLADGAVTTPKMANEVEELFGFRNRIINGDMRISQRNANNSVTWNNSNGHSLDRYFTYASNGGGVFTTQQSTDAPTDFTNSLTVTVTTADTSLGTGDVYFLQQKIEGFNAADLNWGTASAKTITVSFWIKSSLTGSFPFTIIDSGGGSDYRSYGALYTINSANTWEYKTITIPGDTSGSAWFKDNRVGMQITWGLGGGTNYVVSPNTWTANKEAYKVTGDTNVIGTLNATWRLTGVQVEVGSTATPFERRPYGTELVLCQRYFQKSYEQSTAVGTATSANALIWYPDATTNYASVSSTLFVPMRAGPTFALYSSGTGASGKIRNSDSGTDLNGVPNGSSSTSFHFTVNGVSAGQSATLRVHFTAESEI
jgi:hypothetical protein